MASRYVRPEKIRTLRDWTARYPRVVNLGFDQETREPTVYSADAARTAVNKIPWKREGDMMTILSQPAQFAGGAVDAARRRYQEVRAKQKEVGDAATVQIQTAEAALLEAWRTYYAAPPETRSTLVRSIVTAERAVREIEEAVAGKLAKERSHVRRGELHATYNPSIPMKYRPVSLTAAAGAGAAAAPLSSEEASPAASNESA